MIVNEENIPKENNVAKNQIIRYTCKYNQCNNQFLTDQLINIVEENFDLSAMEDGFLLYYEEYLNNQTDSSKDNSSFPTTSQTEKPEPPFNIFTSVGNINKTYFVFLIHLTLTSFIIFL